MRTALALLAVLLIVLANGFFVAAEYALVTMRRTRVQELVDQGSRGARRVSDLQQNPARFISAIQLGVTLSSLALGAIGEPVISNLLDTPLGWLPSSWHGGVALTISAILAFSILSFFHVVLGEIVPKSYTLQHAERVALVVATPINIFYAIFRPFIWALVAASAAVLRWLGLPPGARRSSVHSEEELKMLVTASREQGVLEEEEQTMLHKVFAFADKDAADVMVPRPDVVALPLELPVAELLRLMLQHPYTRYPVYDGELDDVVGVLHVRDLFAALHDRGIDGVDVRALLRPAIMVPETKRLDELLSDFRATSNHMAIVVDEYGSLAGLATLEDLLEEIVGEIGDEFDVPGGGHPAAGRRSHAAGRVVPDRGVQRAVRDVAARRGLPQRRRLRVRRAGPRAQGGRLGQDRRRAVRGERGGRPAHRRGGRDAEAAGDGAGGRGAGPGLRLSGQLVRAPGHLDVAVGDAAGAVVDPVELDAAPADEHVRVMVGRLGGVRHPVREGHRLGEVVEPIALVQGAGLLRPAAAQRFERRRQLIRCEYVHRVAAYRGIVRFSHAARRAERNRSRDHRDPPA